MPETGPWWLIDGAGGLFAWRVLDANGLYPLADAQRDLRAQAASVTTPLSAMETLAGWQAASTNRYALAAVAGDLLTGGSPATWVTYWLHIGRGLTWQGALQAAFGRSPEQFYPEFERYRASLAGPRGRVTRIQRIADCQWDIFMEVTGMRPGGRMRVSNVNSVYYDCQTGASAVRNWGPLDAGAADSTGRFSFAHRHSDYGNYHVVVEDDGGNRVQIDVGYDRNYAGTP